MVGPAVVALLGIGVGFVSVYYWCLVHTSIPIFETGELSGDVDALVARLGMPGRHRSISLVELRTDQELERLFGRAEIRGLQEAQYELWEWPQRCLGSIVRNFAVVSDAQNRRIVLVGGESKYRGPIYLGG